MQSPFSFELDTCDIGEGFTTVDIAYDTEKGVADVFAGGRHLFKVRMSHDCPTGLSYLVLQCATDGESKGFYIKSLNKK